MKPELIQETAAYRCYRQPVLFGNTNCYLLVDLATKQAAVIDPGGDAEAIAKSLAELEAKPALILNTHGHWDHIGANRALQKRFDLPLLIHEADAVMLQDSARNAAVYYHGDGDGGQATRLLRDGDTVELGQLRLSVLHTPGHTPGGICLLLDSLLFSGDTLFQLSIGRSDLPGGDFRQLMQSLQRLLQLDDHLLVLPGHGPASGLGYEKAHNPYLRVD